MGDISSRYDGGRAGFWGMTAPAEAFIDQLMTLREFGFNFCTYRDDYDRYESLPEWVRWTLDERASDSRPEQYRPKQLEQACIGRPRRGQRRTWMIHLNNKYALDGRDPSFIQR